MRFLSILLLFLCFNIQAQTPQAIKYQAVARDNAGNLIANQNIGFRINILQNSPIGNSVYAETHVVASNDLGLVHLDIGAGTNLSGNFSTINWGASSYFIKVEMDVTGGTNYLLMGTSQLLSVPYALFAEKAASVLIDQVNDADADSTNEIQQLSINGNQLSISDGNTVTIPSGSGSNYSAGNGIAIQNNTITNTAPDQVISLTGQGATSITGTYPNFVINSIDNVNDADANPSNELQTLSINGNTLSISNGNSITLNNSQVSLDQAYDSGGAGLGRTITTDAGSVQIINSGNNSTALEVSSSIANSSAVLANVGGVGVGFRAESTNPTNSFAAIQANTNSNNAQNSAILGNNSGNGYAISGQIPSTGFGTSAVYGSNLRTNGGSGVLGIGFNGIVGQSQNAQGYGLYGVNNSPATGTNPSLGIGTYGLGFHGIYGQTTNTTLGWAGYFTADLGCDGAGYALGGWVNASDRRLKSNIISIEAPLQKLQQIEGKYYSITTKSLDPHGKLQLKSRMQYGIIAQDVEKQFPEMISEKALFINTGDETTYKTVEYTQLIPVLIEAVKELNTKVEKLESELKTLKASQK